MGKKILQDQVGPQKFAYGEPLSGSYEQLNAIGYTVRGVRQTDRERPRSQVEASGQLPGRIASTAVFQSDMLVLMPAQDLVHKVPELCSPGS